MPNGTVHSGCTDPTQATAQLIIVLVSMIQNSGAGDNNFVKWKGPLRSDWPKWLYRSKRTTFKGGPKLSGWIELRWPLPLIQTGILGQIEELFWIARWAVQSFFTFGYVRNNSVTSQHGGLEISSSGFELAWNCVVFRVFPAVFARLFVTQQRRRNGRRLVHKVMNNGYEMLEKARFFFWRTCQFRAILRVYHFHFGISLVKMFFRS